MNNNNQAVSQTPHPNLDQNLNDYADILYADQEDMIIELLERQLRRQSISRQHNLPSWGTIF